MADKLEKGTPILDDEHYHDTTPTGSTQSSQRQRTSQACNKCRERKTKVKVFRMRRRYAELDMHDSVQENAQSAFAAPRVA